MNYVGKVLSSKIILIFCILFVNQNILADRVELESIRVWPSPSYTRIVFDVSDSVKYSLLTLDNPSRLVIDLKETNGQHKDVSDWSKTAVSGLRHARRGESDWRFVFDLNQKVKTKTFTLEPNNNYGHRLVLDLYLDDDDNNAKQPIPVKRDYVVALDAGHGGKDPGAIGRDGLKEKDVVLAISKELASLINQTPGYKAVLTRSGDYYVDLRHRNKVARDAGADLFISIHADAFKDRSARGASVFTLSERGASSEASRWLAERDNSSYLVGGITLDDKDDVLASVLLDLSQSASNQFSHLAAQRVLDKMGKMAHLHKSSVQRAGFVVLKSPDIPSMLIETGFISNPPTEKKLKSKTYQKELAKAIYVGVIDYFKYEAPDNRSASTVQTADLEYVIKRGDTLSTIAERYGISVNSLKKANSLTSDVIKVGTVLQIPSKRS